MSFGLYSIGYANRDRAEARHASGRPTNGSTPFAFRRLSFCAELNSTPETMMTGSGDAQS